MHTHTRTHPPVSAEKVASFIGCHRCLNHLLAQFVWNIFNLSWFSRCDAHTHALAMFELGKIRFLSHKFHTSLADASSAIMISINNEWYYIVNVCTSILYCVWHDAALASTHSTRNDNRYIARQSTANGKIHPSILPLHRVYICTVYTNCKAFIWSTCE